MHRGSLANGWPLLSAPVSSSSSSRDRFASILKEGGVDPGVVSANFLAAEEEEEEKEEDDEVGGRLIFTNGVSQIRQLEVSSALSS